MPSSRPKRTRRSSRKKAPVDPEPESPPVVVRATPIVRPTHVRSEPHPLFQRVEESR